ncbi:hypothetical protein ACWDTP_25120 [Mycobacterium sp. NPDC003449]
MNNGPDRGRPERVSVSRLKIWQTTDDPNGVRSRMHGDMRCDHQSAKIIGKHSKIPAIFQRGY